MGKPAGTGGRSDHPILSGVARAGHSTFALTFSERTMITAIICYEIHVCIVGAHIIWEVLKRVLKRFRRK